MKIPPPVITREHGSWAVVLVPMIVGLSCAGGMSMNAFLFALSSLGIFLCYVPAHTILRSRNPALRDPQRLRGSYIWGSVYLSAAILFAVPLLLHGLFLLILFALIGTAVFFVNYALVQKGQKTILSDLTAVAGLTMSAPGIYYAATGSLDDQAAVIWLLNMFFFGSSVFYVHMKIRVTAMKKDQFPLSERFTLGRMNLLYHGGVVAAMMVLSLYQYIPFSVLLAFGPMTIHALYGTVKLRRTVRFKRLGFILLAHSMMFTLLLILLW